MLCVCIRGVMDVVFSACIVASFVVACVLVLRCCECLAVLGLR